MATERPVFSTLGSTVYACEQIVEFLKPKLEGGKKEIDKVQTVERHIGRFDKPEEIKRWLSNRDGGVRIAALSVADYQNVGGRVIGTVDFAAYIFTTDYYGYSKDTRAEVIAGKLVKALFGRRAPTTAYSKAEGFRANNLYSTSIDEKGVAIWAVTWRQNWLLDEEIDLAELDDFLIFGLTGELDEDSPTIDGEVPLPQ